MFASKPLSASDPELARAIDLENQRQEDHIELIASENYTSPAVMAAQGSQLTNKYAEGYPGKRYYGGCEVVDVAENLAISRAKQLFGAMGIARDDKQRRQDWVLRGFRQFDAPVCVIITYDRVLASSDDTAFDCGAVATALVNAAWSRGLGAVINSQGIMQSPVVREHAGIADDQVIMKSIALGWPDHDFPANAVVSQRKSVDEATTFVGF